MTELLDHTPSAETEGTPLLEVKADSIGRRNTL